MAMIGSLSRVVHEGGVQVYPSTSSALSRYVRHWLVMTKHPSGSATSSGFLARQQARTDSTANEPKKRVNVTASAIAELVAYKAKATGTNTMADAEKCRESRLA